MNFLGTRRLIQATLRGRALTRIRIPRAVTLSRFVRFVKISPPGKTINLGDIIFTLLHGDILKRSRLFCPFLNQFYLTMRVSLSGLQGYR